MCSFWLDPSISNEEKGQTVAYVEKYSQFKRASKAECSVMTTFESFPDRIDLKIQSLGSQ